MKKDNWKPLLEYVRRLHRKATQPKQDFLPHPWETICPDEYGRGKSFGHWDIVHAVFDALQFDPEHARCQLENILALQQPDGFLPGSVNLGGEKPRWNPAQGHPPVWPFAVHDYFEMHNDTDLLARALKVLQRQITWFDNNRQSEDGGFYYMDIINRLWESGVDEGIRFSGVKPGHKACVDATSHVYAMLGYAADWTRLLGRSDSALQKRYTELGRFIRDKLYVPDTGFFHDIWAVGESGLRRGAFEGMWPVVTGAANDEQARRVITEHLLNPERFRTPHPISTVSCDDPHFERRMWRGPAWNSMTYWAARGCARYGFHDQACRLVEMALDDSAVQFDRTGTIWEFYDPFGDRPEELKRKPHYGVDRPYSNYLGHNPLLAMAQLYRDIGG